MVGTTQGTLKVPWQRVPVLHDPQLIFPSVSRAISSIFGGSAAGLCRTKNQRPYKELAFRCKRRELQPGCTSQEEVQPGCTRQEDVQPGCSITLA